MCKCIYMHIQFRVRSKGLSPPITRPDYSKSINASCFLYI